ncbi:MAG: hypothetical protein B6D72_18955 [gamma proteobacterium symbiont of Ctena orbiculata]|uniref:Uncharacterized protein n=1 Tax=Candidatus Thiodiazotropha taylori TaxID=2792791 RepID=A0A944M8R1_9GAMM|nr:hypothetical protein [Candidatus Thiodiazotropha taylori]PVV07084.1 MAG: hypothetical protein B6D72_18955 [gamma proteobacterium symbiont of Ctena orbiculata]MBT2989308.1 hypothetical protein [Candidatus Thiodiazotropha taylori]MBT2996888.1 hypothetical protein [Candidatus Thiodiazotropha taylori]MBT3000743.1 hypothetical protein [Candidatus Thiodiazotropha taylori]
MRFTTILVLSCTITITPGYIHACGWWGDGEVNRDDSEILTTPDGRVLPEILNHHSSKLPGRMGYGIAIPDPGRAIPYLRATMGRPLNRIAELSAFGFKTVIDLGTPEKSAHHHRQETEALGMRYISIPVVGNLPSREDVEGFTQHVVDASDGMLLVYAPRAELLGAMWAAHRMNLGAPTGFAVREGRELGMKSDQEIVLRKRYGTKK